MSAVNVTISRELHRRCSTERVFDDWLAHRLGGRFVHEAVERTLAAGNRSTPPVMPLARFRLAEDRLAAAVERGCHQYLVLGAGLDTSGYRHAAMATERGLTVFEVDAPPTQRFKRSRLSAAGIPEPEHVRFVPVDFEVDDLSERLAAAGFDPRAEAVVACLGVVYCLTAPAIAATLSFVGSLATGSELVLDYFRPHETWDLGMRNGAVLAATNGEPWISTFSDSDLDELLRQHGLAVVDRLTGPNALRRYPTDDPALVGNDAMVAVVARVDSRPRAPVTCTPT